MDWRLADGHAPASASLCGKSNKEEPKVALGWGENTQCDQEVRPGPDG